MGMVDRGPFRIVESDDFMAQFSCEFGRKIKRLNGPTCLKQVLHTYNHGRLQIGWREERCAENAAVEIGGSRVGYLNRKIAYSVT